MLCTSWLLCSPIARHNTMHPILGHWEQCLHSSKIECKNIEFLFISPFQYFFYIKTISQFAYCFALVNCSVYFQFKYSFNIIFIFTSKLKLKYLFVLKIFVFTAFYEMRFTVYTVFASKNQSIFKLLSVWPSVCTS